MNAVHLKSLGLALFAMTCLGAAIFLLDRVGTSVLPRGERYEIEADVRDAVAIAAAADVRQAGVKIGRVKAVKEKGAITALKLDLDRKYAPVYRDATVLLRAKSIAEENYVELEPGTPRSGAVENGGVLPVSREREATQNDDVFSIFDRERRVSLRKALGGLGGGLDGKGGRDLNATLEAMAATVDDGSDFARILAAQRSHVARLVDSFGTVTRALGERGEAIRTLTRAAKTEAEAVAARDDELQATLDALPAFLRQGRASAARLGGFSARATPVMRDLRLATDALVPAVRDLRPAAARARGTLRSLESFARAGRPAFAELRPFASATERFVAPYEGFLRQLNPFVKYLDPYWREISTWFAVDAANTDFKDAVGHVARVTIPVSRSSFPATLPAEVEDLVEQLSGPGLDTRGSNAFPEPGTVSAGTPRRGEYPRLAAEPAYDDASR